MKKTWKMKLNMKQRNYLALLINLIQQINLKTFQYDSLSNPSLKLFFMRLYSTWFG